MKKHKNPVIQGIVSLIGIDYYLLKLSGEENILKFFISGFFVILIFVISFFSVFYGFDLMFNMWYAELLLASFFSLTFLTIYILLIQTFSKETLPSSYKTTFFSTSNITRICFVLLISFLIAQPIKIFFLKDILDNEISGYKDSLYKEFEVKSRKLYQNDLGRLNKRYTEYNRLTYNGSSLLITQIEDQINEINNRIEKDDQAAYFKISNSDFFLKRIVLANKYPQSWFICLIVMAIFSIPVYLIYSISDHSNYYLLKKDRDHKLVLDEYEKFKVRYHSIFQTNYGKDIPFCELYEDPPFNKIKKPEPVYLDHNDFYKDIFEL